MPGLVLPFSGPASNFMVSCRGFVDVSSSRVPSYTAPMPVLVKRLPSITMRALSRPVDISWPSISRAVTVHGPCSRSISCAIVRLRQDYSWSYAQPSPPGSIAVQHHPDESEGSARQPAAPPPLEHWRFGWILNCVDMGRYMSIQYGVWRIRSIT